MEKTLNTLPLNKKGIIKKLKTDDERIRRIVDLGIVKGTKITALYKNITNDVTAYLIRGTVIALRDEDAKMIVVG